MTLQVKTAPAREFHTEQVDVPWKSQNEGVMHACGHDVHMTVGLGTAELLMGMKDDVLVGRIPLEGGG